MLTRPILLLLLLTLPIQAQSDLEFIWNKDGFGGLFDRGPQIAYSPDGTRLVAGDVEGTIRILSMPDGEILHTLKYPDGYVLDLDYAPNGKYVAVLLTDGQASPIIIIDPISAAEIDRLSFKNFPGKQSLCISDDSQLLLLASSHDVTIYAWPGLEETWRYEYNANPDSGIELARISSNNELIAIGLSDQFMVIERESKKERVRHRLGSTEDLKFFPNSEILLTSWREEKEGQPNFASFNARGGEQLETFRKWSNAVPRVIELTPAGSAALFTDDNSVFHIQDLDTREFLQISPESGASQIAISPDSMYIALGRGRGQLSLIRSPWNRVNTDVHDPATHSWDFSVTPNPAEAEVTISFTVPAGGAAVKLELYNLRGQLLHQLLDDFLPAGEQHLRITAAELVAKGTNVHQLFCSLTMQNKTQNMLIYLGH